MDQVEPIGETWRLNPDYHKVSDFLGVNVYDRNDFELAKKVFALKDWALSKSKGKSLNDALWEMKSFKKELGHQFIGKPLVVEMYKNMRLSENRKQEAIDNPVKTEVKVEPKVEKKPDSLEGVIKQAVQSTIAQAVKEAVSDKDFLTKSIKDNVK